MHDKNTYLAFTDCSREDLVYRQSEHQLKPQPALRRPKEPKGTALSFRFQTEKRVLGGSKLAEPYASVDLPFHAECTPAYPEYVSAFCLIFLAEASFLVPSGRTS